MRRIFSGLFVLILLIGTVTLASNIQPVRASGTIYIRADGNIDPPTAPISTIDNITYTFTSNIYESVLAERDNIIIDGNGCKLEGVGFDSGFDLSTKNNVTIKNTNIIEFCTGIALDHSYNNVILNNNLTGNAYGIELAWYSLNNTILGNRAESNSGTGIVIAAYSSNNNVVNNTVTNNECGIALASYASGNLIVGNSAENNTVGFYIGSSSNNMICNNNFIQSIKQVETWYSTNVWDNGYPSGGNFWSDYTGVDADGDGIGDTPYVIDADNQDRYPLMHPWGPLPVHNINTGLGYETIQEAINAPETLDGHTIFVDAGLYYENVVVNKTLSLIGENREATIIDGKFSGDAVTVLSNGTSLSSFTIQASGFTNCALRLENVSSTTIVNNTLTDLFFSIFDNSSRNTLTRNSIRGLRFSGSFNNTLTENAIEAFWLDFSPNTKLRDNDFSYFEVGGDMELHFIHDIDSSNMLNEKPIYYWVSRENAEVPSDVGYVALINCLNITVRGSNFENNFQGIIMFSTNNSRILNNNITNINEGIWISSSSNDNISGNNISSNYDGIDIWSSSNNSIAGNYITDNGFGIQLHNECSNNNILGNNITANYLGIWLLRSSNNNIFHNNFINNGVQVDSYKSINTWDDGYPSGGNYWSDYNGTDLWSGPYQNETGSDGIGDVPYIIDESNVDHYPLANPFVNLSTTLVGDLNGDGKVSLEDLTLLASAYNSKPEDPNWNPLADIAPPYSIISLTDLVTMAMHYGQHNP
jgi:parallel beta-helix repeat protein